MSLLEFPDTKQCHKHSAETSPIATFGRIAAQSHYVAMTNGKVSK